MISMMLAQVSLAAEALITWTPMTYFITVAIVHAIVTFVGFRVLQVDPEHNSILGVIIGAAVIGAAGFFLKDGELFSALGLIGVIFIVQLGVSGGEAIKAIMVGVVCIGAYGAVGTVILPRTPLTIEDVGGLTQVVMEGEFKVEPVESQEDSLYEHTKAQTEEDDE